MTSTPDLMTATSASVPSLTLDRIHADPALAGPGLRNLKVSPDGSRVTFLRGRPDDQFQLDLWQYHVQEKRMRLLVDSSMLAPDQAISADEQARRERARTANLRGILDYSWSPDGKQLLVPVGGDLYLVDVNHPEQARRVASGNVLDAKISPHGRYLSFVREQNLFVIDLLGASESNDNDNDSDNSNNNDNDSDDQLNERQLDERRFCERQLTSDGGGTIHNGEAEFIAQEEMGQRTGYCWAPDDSAIAYKQFDEAPVPIVRRVEIFAERTDIIEQRYPAAGEPNVLVQLMIVAPSTGVQRHVDLGLDTDIYLVRADWSADSRTLLYQRQSRDQKRLDLIAVDSATLAQRTVLSETSSTWVSIHDDLRFLKQRNALLWTSERSGRNHLYLVDLDGNSDSDVLHPISSGDWGIDNVLAIDEQLGHVFVASNRDAIIDKQVYRLDYRRAIDAGTDSIANDPLRITAGDGWHDAVFAANGAVFVDTFSHPDTPPQVSLRSPDGALLGWLEQNVLNSDHPYAPYRNAHLTTEYGTLTSCDGQTLHYSLLKPGNVDASTRYPVFVSTYGGPHAQHVARRWGNLFDQFIAQQGFVVFRLDNRGSSRRERVFTDAIHRNLGACEVADQLVGVNWLAQQDFVDATRIGVFGWSYGGFMALRLLAEASDQIAIGVAVAPVTDWALYDTHYTEQFMGMPDDNADGYQNSSVYAHLDGLRSPLLLMHGMADDNVLFSNTTRMIAALVERGVQFDLMTYPGAKHGMSSRADQRHVFGMIASFFDQHLKRARQQN